MCSWSEIKKNICSIAFIVLWRIMCTLCLKNAPTLKRYSSKIININFDEIWQKYLKDFWIEFACFSFHVGFYLFLSIFDTENNANFDAVSSKRGNLDSVKEDKLLIKNLYECTGYNARQFITEFPDKGWTKNSINGEVEKVRNSQHVNSQCDA